MEHIHASLSVSVSEFKKSPSALLAQAGQETVALLNHNKPMAYVVPAKRYELMMEALEDVKLLELAKQRLEEIDQAIKVNIDDL